MFFVRVRKQHRAAILSLALPEPNTLVSTTYDKRVKEFDLRMPPSLVAEHTEHRAPVLALACSDSYVYTGGEDRCVCVWDRRSHQVLQTVKVPITYSFKQPPTPSSLILIFTHIHTDFIMIIDLHVPICPPSSMLYIQLPRLVSGLHCGYGKLSCSGQKRITIFDISQGTLTKLSVNYTFAVGYCNKIVYTVSLPLITVERVQPVCMTFKNNNVNEICKKCFVLHE